MSMVGCWKGTSNTWLDTSGFYTGQTSGRASPDPMASDIEQFHHRSQLSPSVESQGTQLQNPGQENQWTMDYMYIYNNIYIYTSIFRILDIFRPLEDNPMIVKLIESSKKHHNQMVLQKRNTKPLLPRHGVAMSSLPPLERPCGRCPLRGPAAARGSSQWHDDGGEPWQPWPP